MTKFTDGIADELLFHHHHHLPKHHHIDDHQVKKETIPLAGDYIVRVTGRASPYNINRLTLYTKQGDSDYWFEDKY